MRETDDGRLDCNPSGVDAGYFTIDRRWPDPRFFWSVHRFRTEIADEAT